MPSRGSGDASSNVPTSPLIRHTDTNGPQQHATRQAASVSAESLDVSGSRPVGQERQAITENSPLRPQLRAPSRGTSRSRKNSQDLSPARNPVNAFSHPVPSAAAVQRALSANKPPRPASGIDNLLESHNPKSTDSTPRWPISPRLTSPPPSIAPRNSTHSNWKSDNDMAAVNPSQKTLSASVPDLSIAVGKPISEKEDSLPPRSGLKTPARGVSGVTSTLETVAENSVPDKPSNIPPSESLTISSPQDFASLHNDDMHDVTQSKTAKGSGDSGSDNGGAKAKVDTVAKPGTVVGSKASSSMAKKSLTNLAPVKNKQHDC